MLAIILAIENEQDRSFVEWIYETYEKKMYADALEILKDHHDAEDCVHEAVRKIIDALPSFRDAEDKGSLGGLVAITCRNCAVNMFRKRERLQEHVVSIGDLMEVVPSFKTENLYDEADDARKIVISEENCRYIQSLIESLDEKYRDVLLLRCKGLSYAQIGTLLGITEETARQRMVRGRRLLIKNGGIQLYET